MLTVIELGLITLTGIATALGCVYFGFWMGRHTEGRLIEFKPEMPDPGPQPKALEDDPYKEPMYGTPEKIAPTIKE